MCVPSLSLRVRREDVGKIAGSRFAAQARPPNNQLEMAGHGRSRQDRIARPQSRQNLAVFVKPACRGMVLAVNCEHKRGA